MHLYVPCAEYAQNSLHQPVTSLNPFQYILAFQPPLFPWSGKPSAVPVVDHWFKDSKRVWNNTHTHTHSSPTSHLLTEEPDRCSAFSNTTVPS